MSTLKMKKTVSMNHYEYGPKYLKNNATKTKPEFAMSIRLTRVVCSDDVELQPFQH